MTSEKTADSAASALDDGLGAWMPFDTAPKDGTPIQVRIPGHGSDNIIFWMSEGFLDSDGNDCGGWAFLYEDQEPPSCWTDGVCWTVNEDGKASVLPTHWKAINV